MNAIQTKIRDYLGDESDPDCSSCFVGMIETGEATYDDFDAAGGGMLRDTVRVTKEKWDAERAVALDDCERSDDSDMFDDSWDD